VVEVGALPLDVLIRFRPARQRFAPTVTALLAACDRLIGFGDPPLTLPKVTRVLDDKAVRRDQEHLHANVYAGLPSGEWQRLHGDIGARDDRVPPIGFPRDRDGLGRSLQRRDQRTATRPILERTKKPLSTRAPLPYCL